MLKSRISRPFYHVSDFIFSANAFSLFALGHNAIRRISFS